MMSNVRIALAQEQDPNLKLIRECSKTAQSIQRGYTCVLRVLRSKHFGLSTHT